MSDFAKPVDYAAITASARVQIFGESSHNPMVFKDEAASSFEVLKRIGFGVFGMEMISTDIDVNSAPAVHQHLRELWTWRNWNNVCACEGYVNLFRTARVAGMRPIALDMPFDLQAPYRCDRTGCIDTAHLERNKWMADQIAEAAKKSRVVTFMHFYHAITRGTADDGQEETGVKPLLIDKGLPAVLVRLVGGPPMFYGEPEYCKPGPLDTEIKARQQGVADQRFYMRARGGKHNEDFDLHLPQPACSSTGSAQQ